MNGSRVAIVGGGVAGTALAAALLFTARARGRHLEVRVFEGPKDELRHRPPAVLTPEGRSRLAALGCRVPPQWRTVELNGIEVISGRRRELVRAPSGGLWVVDEWPLGAPGQSLVAGALAGVAALHGARFVPRRVERIEMLGAPSARRVPTEGPGSFVLWSHGANERAHAVALAAGSGSPLGESFFPGFSGAPTLPAVQARLRYDAFSARPWLMGRLVLSPMPGVDGLYLLPARGSVYALAWGEAVQPADLCQALMICTRDGHLEEGFEIAHLSQTRVPAGAGRRLTAPGRLALGGAAFGYPLQLGVRDALTSASRAALALVESAADGRELKRRYTTEGIFDLLDDARAGAKAGIWLRRAGEAAAPAVAGARLAGAPSFGSGVLGLRNPPPQAVLQRARRVAVGQALKRLWRSSVLPVPRALPQLERALVYVVDDDDDTREGLTGLLEGAGAEVVSFGDELALFCAVARRPPQALLLDVVLSWVDGLRLCEELKRHPLTRDTRVLVMSGLNRPHVRERALRAGAETFLPKPVDPDRLLQRIFGAAPDAAAAPGRELAGAGRLETDRHAS